MNEQIHEQLKNIIDPELGVDIVTLGLVRDIRLVDDIPHILMTLTTPLCPFADIIIQDVETEVTNGGFGEPVVSLTFDPPWEAGEDVKLLLGI